MSKSISISVSKPCTENWNNFSKNEAGGFCQSCQKNVIDFTQMSDEQIIQYFRKGSKNTCGRFKTRQLKEYPLPVVSPSERHNHHWLPAGFLSLLLFLNHGEGKANNLKQHNYQFSHLSPIKSESVAAKSKVQDLSVTGKVTDEAGYALPGATIWVKGTDRGVTCDINGEFTLNGVYPGDVLVISFIGFNSLEHKISDKEETDLMIHLEMEAELMGEIVVGGAYVAKPGLWQRVKSLFQNP